MTLTLFSSFQTTARENQKSQMVQLVTRTLTKWLFLEGLIPYTAQRQMAIRRFCLQMTQCSRMSHSGLLIGLMYVQRILKSCILNQCSELGILTIGFI